MWWFCLLLSCPCCYSASRHRKGNTSWPLVYWREVLSSTEILRAINSLLVEHDKKKVGRHMPVMVPIETLEKIAEAVEKLDKPWFVRKLASTPPPRTE